MKEETPSMIEAQMREKNAKLQFLLGESNKPYSNYQEDLLNIKVTKSGVKRQSQNTTNNQLNDVEIWRCGNDFEGVQISGQKKSAPRKKKQNKNDN